MTKTFVVGLDSVGDVLLSGPAIAAASADGPVDVLCSPIAAAAALLPGVTSCIELSAPWILDPAPRSTPLGWPGWSTRSRVPNTTTPPSSPRRTRAPCRRPPAPAGQIRHIAAVSNDCPGSLLDHRIPGNPDLHEVERALAVVAALGVDTSDPSARR